MERRVGDASIVFGPFFLFSVFCLVFRFFFLFLCWKKNGKIFHPYNFLPLSFTEQTHAQGGRVSRKGQPLCSFPAAVSFLLLLRFSWVLVWCGVLLGSLSKPRLHS